jgi:hypothetical protein
MAKDPNTGVFYEATNPANAYLTLPQNIEQLDSYKIQGLTEDWLTNEEISSQVKVMSDKLIGGEENIDLNITLPQVDETQPVEEKGFFQKIKDFFGGFGKEKQELGNFSAGNDLIAGSGGDGGGGAGGSDSKIGEFFRGAGQTITDMFTPDQAQAASPNQTQIAGPMMQPKGLDRQSLLGDFQMPKIDFKMPEVNLPDFDLPDFKMPDFNLNRPKATQDWGSNFSQITQPMFSNIKTGVQNVQTGMQNVGSKIKGWGQNLFTGFKNFFGI